jgi:hypothetical protein
VRPLFIVAEEKQSHLSAPNTHPGWQMSVTTSMNSMQRAPIAYPAHRNSDPIGKNSVPACRMMIADYRMRNPAGLNRDPIGENIILMRRMMVRDYRIDDPWRQLE